MREGVILFAVGVTSYWYCISWSQEFCSRTVCLYLTDKIDPCQSQLQGFQPLHDQSAINGVSGCGRILNVNCCKVLITSIDFLDNCNQLKQRYIVCKPLLLEITVINEHAKGELRVHFISSSSFVYIMWMWKSNIKWQNIRKAFLQSGAWH